MVTQLYPTCSKGHPHFSRCSRGQELPVSPASADQTAFAGSELRGLTNMVASNCKNNCITQVSGALSRFHFKTVVIAQAANIQLLLLLRNCFFFLKHKAMSPWLCLLEGFVLFLNFFLLHNPTSCLTSLFQNQTMLIHRDSFRTWKNSFSSSCLGFIRTSH